MGDGRVGDERERKSLGNNIPGPGSRCAGRTADRRASPLSPSLYLVSDFFFSWAKSWGLGKLGLAVVPPLAEGLLEPTGGRFWCGCATAKLLVAPSD